MATCETICKFNQSGFCKFQSHCRKQHVMEVCTNTQCSMVTCLYRHPRVCRYFNNFGRSKFDGSCAYLHKRNDKLSEFKEEQEKEIEKLRKDVEELQKQVIELRNTLNEMANPPNQTSSTTGTSTILDKPASTSSCSSIITMVNSNINSNSQANFGQEIPQLDPNYPSASLIRNNLSV